MAKERRAIILYPAYFDAERSREDGRRVTRRLAVNAPTVEEIARAADSLGLKPRIETERAHPSTPWKQEGRVLVKADYYKTSVVRRIAERVKEARAAKAKGPS
ncbi:MAG: signal recognition particle protein Srp19 [Euryarchaeota archaeon]|nr:signal recognition particle protein Srp19 [Euryarchaeota archaeon]